MKEMDFEEMRNQFAILKEQLQKQEIVSDRLLRETMRTKKNAINSTKRMLYGCVIFCLLVYPLSYFTHTWSLPFTLFTCLVVLSCAAVTHYIHRPVDELNFMKDDFSTVAHVMAKFKKQYDDWLHYMAPILIIPWLAWACYEFAWQYAPEGINPWFMCLPIIVGADADQRDLQRVPDLLLRQALPRDLVLLAALLDVDGLGDVPAVKGGHHGKPVPGLAQIHRERRGERTARIDLLTGAEAQPRPVCMDLKHCPPPPCRRSTDTALTTRRA